MIEAALIEWFFVFWTAFGATFGLVNLVDALRTYRIVRERRLNAGRQFFAVDDVRRELLRLLAQAILMFIAGVAMLTPNRIAPARSWFAWVVLGAFLLLPAILAANSLGDLLARRKLRRYYPPEDRR